MMFELHVWGPAFSLPSIEPQCLAAIVYLRQLVPQDEWVLIASCDDTLSPTSTSNSSRSASVEACLDSCRFLLIDLLPTRGVACASSWTNMDRRSSKHHWIPWQSIGPTMGSRWRQLQFSRESRHYSVIHLKHSRELVRVLD